MNDERYFEQDPWMRACLCVKDQSLGNVLQISVNCVCKKGSLHRQLQEWEYRVIQLVGKKLRGDLLSSGAAMSFVGVFGNSVIVRFFLDEGTDAYCENFEIVTAKSLIVWKPGSSNQGQMLTEDGCFVEASQQYVADLREVNC